MKKKKKLEVNFYFLYFVFRRKSTKSKEDVEKEAVHKTENGNYLNPGFEREDEIQ